MKVIEPMKLPVFLAGLVLAVLLAGACLAAILIYFNPNDSDLEIFILFYFSLFIGLTSLFSLIGWLIRRLSWRRKSPLPLNQAFHNLEVSFRQGILLAVILIVVLILQSERILTWWYLIILVVLVGLIEWWLAKNNFQ